MLRQILALLLFTALVSGAAPSLDRIVVIGASVSRGFTVDEPLGGEKSNQLRLDTYLDQAITAPHGRIFNDANHLFFRAPEKEALIQIRRQEQRQPTLVIAVDFLFWFLYGYPSPDSKGRLDLFEQGLDLLSKVQAPLVVGDIPDTSASIGKMLNPRMIPSAEVRDAANRRLADWARKRGNVAIVKLSDFVEAVQSNAAIEADDTLWPAGTTRDFLQPDRLHPTPGGAAALSFAIMDAATRLGIPRSAIRIPEKGRPRPAP